MWMYDPADERKICALQSNSKLNNNKSEATEEGNFLNTFQNRNVIFSYSFY